MSDKDKEVGRRLKSERQRLGLNIFSVAESIMRSKTGYEKYENGQRSLPRELEEPLQGLGFDMDYVVRNIRRHYPVAQKRAIT
jgi:transcriptional regulator with XRE-family HTH domain